MDSADRNLITVTVAVAVARRDIFVIRMVGYDAQSTFAPRPRHSAVGVNQR